MNRIVGRLTYANVMATIAVFIALGGASYAAIKVPKNSVGAKQIRNGAITTAKIRNGAVRGSKVAASTLGTVPSATRAGTADTAANAQALQGQTAAQIAAAAKPTCPRSMIAAVGLCFEPGLRASATLPKAVMTCAEAGGILPGVAEIHTFAFESGLQTTTVEWAGQEWYDGSEFVGTGIASTGFGIKPANEANAFRCAFAPTS